jgi:hypothetical protein
MEMGRARPLDATRCFMCWIKKHSRGGASTWKLVYGGEAHWASAAFSLGLAQHGEARRVREKVQLNQGRVFVEIWVCSAIVVKIQHWFADKRAPFHR